MTIEDLDKIVNEGTFQGEELDWYPIEGQAKQKKGEFAFALGNSIVFEKWTNPQGDRVIYYKQNPAMKGAMLCGTCDSEIQQDTPLIPIHEFPEQLAGYGRTKQGESLPYCGTCEEKPYSGGGLKMERATTA